MKHFAGFHHYLLADLIIFISKPPALKEMGLATKGKPQPVRFFE